MALTPAGAVATQTHRRAQGTLATLVVRDVLELWSMLDPRRLDATTPAWLRLVLPLLDRHRETSARLASDYYQRFRAIEIPDAQPFIPAPRADLDAWRRPAEVSLLVTGPGTVKRLSGRGIDPDEAAISAAGPSVAAAAIRLVADAGRAELDDAIEDDPIALGWMRVTSATPCAFCAMLASRGPVYPSESAALDTTRGGVRERYHDGCLCTVEPVLDPATDWPDSSRRFADLWETTTAGKSGAAARNAFRRALQAEHRAS